MTTLEKFCVPLTGTQNFSLCTGSLLALLSSRTALNDTKTLTNFTVSAIWVVWVDILSDLSFDGFGHFLVFLDTS